MAGEFEKDLSEESAKEPEVRAGGPGGEGESAEGARSEEEDLSAEPVLRLSPRRKGWDKPCEGDRIYSPYGLRLRFSPKMSGSAASSIRRRTSRKTLQTCDSAHSSHSLVRAPFWRAYWPPSRPRRPRD